MMKIEDQNTDFKEAKDGWYIDAPGEPWFFREDKPLIALTNAGEPYGGAVLTEPSAYEPFTRLTGRIIISND